MMHACACLCTCLLFYPFRLEGTGRVWIAHRSLFATDAEKSLDIYGEKPGGLELCGIFTVYSQEAYDNLSEAQICEVLKMNTLDYV